jgi:hypothetical protein
MSMKNSNDNIGNQTRDLPTCSAVPKPTALPRVLDNNYATTKIVHWMDDSFSDFRVHQLCRCVQRVYKCYSAYKRPPFFVEKREAKNLFHVVSRLGIREFLPSRPLNMSRLVAVVWSSRLQFTLTLRYVKFVVEHMAILRPHPTPSPLSLQYNSNNVSNSFILLPQTLYNFMNWRRN